LLSDVAAAEPFSEFRSATDTALHALTAGSTRAVTGAASASADPAFRASVRAAERAADATRSAYAAFIVTDAVDSAAAAVDAGAAWEAVQADIIALEAGRSIKDLPLWSVGNPSAGLWSVGRARVAAMEPGGDFWTSWYSNALAGLPQDWTLLVQVARIPPADWDKGPEHVNAIVAQLRTGRAVQLSDNAERIEINPATGLLRLVPEDELPEDIASYARRKMSRAMDLFGERPENQYTPLDPALRVVREALADPDNPPVELFDACSSSSRLVARLAANEVIPTSEQDALIHEYLYRMREAAADILGTDPKTREVIARRNAIVGNDALIDVRQGVMEAAEGLASRSEGRLAKVLPDDASVATDLAADPEERKASSFRLAGRLVRIAVVAGTGIRLVGDAISGGEKIIGTIEAIRASPMFQMALRAALKYLGL